MTWQTGQSPIKNGPVVIGAFSDKDVAGLLRSPRLQPLYLIPLGRK